MLTQVVLNFFSFAVFWWNWTHWGKHQWQSGFHRHTPPRAEPEPFRPHTWRLCSARFRWTGTAGRAGRVIRKQSLLRAECSVRVQMHTWTDALRANESCLRQLRVLHPLGKKLGEALNKLARGKKATGQMLLSFGLDSELWAEANSAGYVEIVFQFHSDSLYLNGLPSIFFSEVERPLVLPECYCIVYM